MNLMRMLLAHSAAEGSSSGKSQLPEGATWEAVDLTFPFSICVYVLLQVDLIPVMVDNLFRLSLICTRSPFGIGLLRDY